MWARILLGLVVVAVLCGCGSITESRALPNAVPPFPYVSLLRASTRNADAMPTSAVWVKSSRRLAVSATMGDTVLGNEPVYVAVLTGHFVALGESRPDGAAVPNGTVETIVYDARTGLSRDIGLSNRTPDLKRLGTVHDFLPYLEQAAQGTAKTASGSPRDVPASIETQWLERLSAGSRLGCKTRFQNVSPATFRHVLDAYARSGHFIVQSVQFLHACQLAPLIIVQTEQPSQLVAAIPALERRLERPAGVWAFEGSYLEGQDRAGTPFVVTWHHVRAEDAGGQWAAAPDLYPYPHG